MLAYFTKMREENEEGFTLIELLVVIIIIGILAAIAIPVFLNQRKKGYDAGVKSDLRNAATAEETYLTDYGFYTDTIIGATDSLASEGFKASSDSDYGTGGSAAELTVLSDANNTYCITGISASGKTWFYDSGKGGLQPNAAAYTCSDASVG